MRLRLTRARRSRCGVVAKEESCLLDGLYLGTGGGSEARIWDMKSGREVARMVQGFVFAVAFSSSGQQLATASNDRTGHIWDVSSGREIGRVVHDGLVLGVAYSPDGKYLATGGGNMARIWELESRQEVVRLVHDTPKRSVTAVAYSPDGRFLATGNEDHIARVWEIKTQRELA